MIVDDHEIVRRGIAEIIDRADGLDVVAAARRANAAAAEAVSRLGPARSPRRDEIDALLGCGSCRDRPDPQ
mgnify:CR=1 FL=1